MIAPYSPPLPISVIATNTRNHTSIMDTTRTVDTKICMEKKFKNFNETYKFCAFALAIAFIYPNTATTMKRIIIITLIILLNLIEIYWFACYLLISLIKVDVYNFTRTMTVGLLIVLYIFKEFYANYKTEGFEHILQEITNDLLRGNELPKDFQDIYQIYIKRAKMAQACWIVIPLLLGTQFTIYAAVCTIYEYMKTDLWTRYMVIEMDLQHIKHLQYKTPYFELVFAYNCIQSLILATNFCGFDGSFCIATTHMCLKLKIVGYSVQRAFKDIKDREELRSKIKYLIQQHQNALIFYKKLQYVYGGWLFMVFLLTSLLISFNVYQIYYIQRIDPKYTIFALSGILHMYMPCYYASDLIQSRQSQWPQDSKTMFSRIYSLLVSKTVANEEYQRDLYTANWETAGDPVLTRHLIFMIIRAQKALILTGNGIVVFDMQLFVSILQTSYSFFTLVSRK